MPKKEKKDDNWCRRLPVAHRFHSHAMAATEGDVALFQHLQKYMNISKEEQS
jgi:hypothetical protein